MKEKLRFPLRLRILVTLLPVYEGVHTNIDPPFTGARCRHRSMHDMGWEDQHLTFYRSYSRHVF